MNDDVSRKYSSSFSIAYFMCLVLYLNVSICCVYEINVQRLRVEFDSLDLYRQEQELTIAKLSSTA